MMEKRYYGLVEGVPEIPLIEADEIHVFERLFHEAVDDYINYHMESRPRSKSGLYVAGSLFAILLVMILTCPKKDQHLDVLAENFSYVLHSEQASQQDDTSILGDLLGAALVKPLLSTYLTVNYYILFSVGHLTFEGEDHIMSFGAFGHIFTTSKKELKRRMEQNE